MRDELRERRNETWDLLVVKGLKHGEVADELAEKYDVAESTIRADISRMDNWLPKLDENDFSSGISRLRETRENRQRLQRMAVQAQRDNDHKRELKIRKEIDRAIERDVTLSQSLGITPKEPNKHEHTGGSGSPLEVVINREQYSGDDENENEVEDEDDSDE